MDTNPVSSPRSSHDGDDVLRDAAGATPGDGVLRDAILPDAAAVAAATAVAPVPLALRAFPSSVLQTIDIRHHVPVVLDLHGGNYTQWRRFFNTVVGMFGVHDHVDPVALSRLDDPEWRMADPIRVHWLSMLLGRKDWKTSPWSLNGKAELELSSENTELADGPYICIRQGQGE